TAGQLVGRRDANHLTNAVDEFNLASVDNFPANHAQHRPAHPSGTMDVEPKRHKSFHHVLNLRLAGAFLHHNNHLNSLEIVLVVVLVLVLECPRNTRKHTNVTTLPAIAK